MRLLKLSLLLLSLSLFCGPVWGGVSFTDDDDHIDFGDVTGIDGVSSFSAYVVVKFDSLAVGDAIFSKWDATGGDRNFILQIDTTNSDELRFGGTNTTVYLLEPTTALNLTTGVWYKIVVTYTANSDINFYVNGATYATTDDTDNISIFDATVSAPLTLGNYNDLSGVSAKMEVAEVCTWGHYTVTEAQAHSLTSSNVKRHCLQFAPASLTHCYFLDDNADGSDANGATFKDSCGSYDGTGAQGAASSLTAKAETVLSYP